MREKHWLSSAGDGPIKRVEEEAKTKGAIIIPNATAKPQEGEVVSVGPGARETMARSSPWT